MTEPVHLRYAQKAHFAASLCYFLDTQCHRVFPEDATNIHGELRFGQPILLVYSIYIRRRNWGCDGMSKPLLIERYDVQYHPEYASWLVVRKYADSIHVNLWNTMKAMPANLIERSLRGNVQGGI